MCMTLEQEAIQAVKAVPKERLTTLIDFAVFLASSSSYNRRDLLEKKERISIIGRAKDGVSLASDFNDTPDCFKEYI